ncbi:TonB-dependent receptor [Beijerinckia sp. L45]|uniref:TonB-dependent receptor n=1 Tax=Beijerinckia sp. L45 TaxID=1641855 RepID=UPI001FED7956|nr:TonB-dependent receptor [Beijerinckia sp. L45]
MSLRRYRPNLSVTAASLVALSAGAALAQTALPQVTVTEPAKPHPTDAPKRPKLASRAPHAAIQRGIAVRRSQPGIATAGAVQPSAGAGSAGVAAPSAAQQAEGAAEAQRARLLPRVGVNSFAIDKAAIDALPQGNTTSIDRVLLQAPGVSQDSAASGDLHIRNEHANLQYRINGIFLPDGVSGFSQVLDTSLIRSLDVVDGALPAQYGLHTAGLIDVQTKTGAEPGGSIGVYGGSHGTIIPTLTYAGAIDRWDYFFTGRFQTSNLGIENTTPGHDAEHDRTRQGRYFASISGQLEDGSRITLMSGASIAQYQIPNTPGQMPQFTAFGVTNANSSQLNENQVERSIFNVLAWQKNFGALDTQVSYFQRYSTLHFVPDTVNDLVFNGVASDVTRTSLVNGVQSDNAYRFNERNTLRFGLTTNVERAEAVNSSVVLPTDADGNAIDAPFTLNDAERKTGVIAGAYVQDEMRLTPEITINGGLRFDYMHQYTDASQLSPRIGLVYKPVEGTTFHAGYARYFTPPELALSAPTPVQNFANTTAAPGVTQSSPVKPERSHYFDAGVTQRLLPGLDAGVDVYYKIAKNLLDDGQFGQALVLSAFNYDHATNEGVEFKVNYEQGNFRAYGNVAVAQQKASQVSSNQFLFDPDELAFIQNHSIFTDHAQIITASGGLSYLYYGTRLSVDAIYGSGLRDGFANTGTVSPYTTVNLGVTHDFVGANGKPLTARFTVVNLFDHAYEIRDGSGIGVFAAQYGERRGFFAGLTQQF